MNQNIKNALGVIGGLAIIVAAVAAWNWTSAFSRSVTSGATFSVTGQGKSVGVPDVARFSFSITNEGGKDIASLQKDNSTKAKAAIDFLKAQGVDAKDIETGNYSIDPRYQSYSCPPVIYDYNTSAPASAAVSPRPCPPADIVGYTVSQTVEVKVRDFGKIGDLIAGVTAKGATGVSGLSFGVDDPAQLTSEARGKAIADAKAQAEAMAKAGGFSLGRLIGVSEDGGYQSPTYYKLEAQDLASGNAAGAPSPTIEPGSQEVNAQITLTYEIR